jgi:hypothetical protein
MRSTLSACSLVGLCAAVLPPATKPAEDTEPKVECHGTAVEFVDSPKAAAAKATREKKLVMVLHVSGNFEDPGFT